MTPQQFRKSALSLPDTVESEHMGHPDFRVGGRIFASLGAPSADWGMVKLTPEQQQAFCDADSDAFQPYNGAWGRQGCTSVSLAAARTADVRSMLRLAVENAVAAQPRKKSFAKPTPAKRPGKSAKAAPRSTPEPADSEAVTSYIRHLEHPLKPVIENIRLSILKSDSRIAEGIKWNVPSFYCNGWFATFHLRARAGVVLVLHHGAKARSTSTLSQTINDRTGLLSWASADRATITFNSANDFRQKHAALKSIIRQWVEFQVDSGD